MNAEGYVLESFSNMGEAYTCRRLVEEARAFGLELSVLGVSDTQLQRDGTIVSRGGVVRPRDFVVNRYKWGHVKNAVNAICRRGFNDIVLFNRYVDKFSQMQRLRLTAATMPAFVLSNGGADYHGIRERLSTPFVAKGLESSMGREVFLIHDEHDFKELSTRFGMNKEWLFEEAVMTSLGRDLRLFVIRGSVVAAMQRAACGDFRANVALGANCRQVEISQGMRDVAREVHQQTGLTYFGLDLLYGSGNEFVFCEVNVMPGIRGIEEACDVNVAKRIIETIAEEL